MKIIELSDAHLCVQKPLARLDSEMLLTGLAKLGTVFNYAQEHDIHTILQAGDFVDLCRSWELLSELIKFFEYWKKHKIHMYNILGQHDSYYHMTTNEKTIMGALHLTKLVTRLNDKPVLIGEDKTTDVWAYGCSFGEKVPVVTTTGLNILVVHKQIVLKKMFHQQEVFDYAPMFLKRHPEFDMILCGDAHQKFTFKDGRRCICNTGTMMRLEATEANLKHDPCFYVYDTEKRTLEEVSIGAKKGTDVLSREHIVKQEEREANFDSFVTAIKENVDTDSVSFEQNLETLLSQPDVSDSVRKLVSEYTAGV